MRTLLGALLVTAVNAGHATGASAFALLTTIEILCGTCPRGYTLDIEDSYLSNPRWTAAAGTRGLENGLQITIQPGLPAAIGVTDPILAGKIESTIAAGVLAWSSPVLDFDITLGSPTSATEIFIRLGPTASIGGHTDFSTAWSTGRTLTSGELLPGPIFTSGRITLNQATLTTMFASIGESFALGALQRLVAHEMGHALGLGHPTDPFGYNLAADPSGALFISPDTVDDTAIMVPAGDLPSLEVGFDPAMRADDLAGRDVLYPHLLPEPGALGPLGLASIFARGRLRRGSSARMAPPTA